MRIFLLFTVLLWAGAVQGDEVNIDCASPCTVTVNEEPGEPVWDRIIENHVLFKTLRINGSSWDNTLIRNVTIIEPGRYGIFLKSVSNVRIENSRIIGAEGNGIKLSSGGSTEGVVIVGNLIKDSQLSGILSAQQAADAVDHPGLEIVGNLVENSGWKSTHGSHGIYVQSTDSLIEGNTIIGVGMGNGISIRSSGIVRGNYVSEVKRPESAPVGIAYFSDHTTGPSDTLIIEDNVVDQTSIKGPRSHAISIKKPAAREPDPPDSRVHNFVIDGNQIITDGEDPKIYVDGAWFGSDYTVEIGDNPGVERP